MSDEQKEKKVLPGRTKINNSQRLQSFSKRALNGTIEIIKKRCPYCNHHKAIKNVSNIIRCSRCKREDNKK